MEPPDPLLTVQQLSDFLDVPVATLYAWRYRREGPPGFRVGRHLRYRWSDVEAWISRQLEYSHDRGSVSWPGGKVAIRRATTASGEEMMPTNPVHGLHHRWHQTGGRR